MFWAQMDTRAHTHTHTHPARTVRNYTGALYRGWLAEYSMVCLQATRSVNCEYVPAASRLLQPTPHQSHPLGQPKPSETMPQMLQCCLDTSGHFPRATTSKRRQPLTGSQICGMFSRALSHFIDCGDHACNCLKEISRHGEVLNTHVYIYS